MTAEKHKTWQKLPQNPTNQGSQLSNLPDYFEDYLKIQKTGGL